MRKISLFLIVAIVATMFAFVAMPASAAGEGIEFAFEKAPVGANYNYVVTVKAKTALNAVMFTLAYNNDEYMLVDTAGNALSANDVQSAALLLNGVTSTDTRLWLASGLSFGTSEGTIHTNSGIVFTRKSGAIYDIAKVSFNNGAGTGTDTIAQGDLMKFFVKKVGVSTDEISTMFKVVATDDALKVTNAIFTSTLNTGLSSANATFGGKPYTAIQYGALKSGVKLGSNLVAAYDVTDSQVTWTPVATATNKITADIEGSGKVLVNGTAIADGGSVETDSATIKVIPAIGFEVATATLDGANLNIPKNGGKATATVDGEQALVVTFAARATDLDKPQAANVTFDQDAVTFPGAAAPAKAKTTFASAPAGVTECGIKLEKDGVPYTTPSGDGSMFKTTKALSATNQYGIQFIGLPAGTYTATPYAIVGGETKLGLAVTFTVE